MKELETYIVIYRNIRNPFYIVWKNQKRIWYHMAKSGDYNILYGRTKNLLQCMEKSRNYTVSYG